MSARPAVMPSPNDPAAARRAFRDLPETSVATVDRAGRPHVVPLWFVWLEDAIYLTCREGSVVAANLRRLPEVALAMARGRTWVEHVGVMVRGRAEFLPPDHAAAKRALSAWFDKYRGQLGGDAFAAYTEQVERPLVVRVSLLGISGWSHAGPAGR